MDNKNFIDLLTLQECIKEQVDGMQAWVKAELDSCNCSGGHHYLGLLQKSPKGAELAKARAIIWRSSASLVSYFEHESGIMLKPGISVLLLVKVNYDPRYGLSLIVEDIDPEYTVGQRELEKQKTIEKLGKLGLLERQKALELPYLPGRIAVISSADAAGYGDFCRQLEENAYGFRFDTSLFHSIMQGDKSPASVAESLAAACEEEGAFDLVVILRGGGARSDLFCFDDYDMCEAIASCPIPVITAIGHDRDFHIADMVAHDYVKTPTALAAFLIDWVAGREQEWKDCVAGIRLELDRKIARLEEGTSRCVSSIAFALRSAIKDLEHQAAMIQERVIHADPREILKLGYVLACDPEGRILKNSASAREGEQFVLRFADGRWVSELKTIITE